MKKTVFQSLACFAVIAAVVLVPVYAMCNTRGTEKYKIREVIVMEKKKQKFDWNKRIGNSDKGTSDYLHPAIAYGASGGALALALLIALIVIL